MPGIIRITRGAAAPKMTRGDVKQGLVFTVKRPDGRTGKKYAAIGANGRMYSVNLDTSELASSGNRNSEVTLIGKWAFDVDRTYKHGTNRVGQQMKRSAVRQGEVFSVKGGAKEYAHVGSITRARNGWLSVPLRNPENHAVSENGDSTVTVVGTFAIKVELAQ